MATRRSRKKQQATAARLSTAWPPFTERLAEVLGALEEDQYLAITVKGTNRFVQFAARGAFGMRAETTSNSFLARSDRLSPTQVAALVDAGWKARSGRPDDATPENDPDGSPNFFAEFRPPVPFGAIAQLTVRTLAEVLRVPHPGFLAYEAFDVQGGSVVLPMLGLKRAEPRSGQNSESDPAHLLLDTVRACTGISDLNFDREGDIALRYGSVGVLLRLVDQSRYVRISSALVSDVEEAPELLARLNEINATWGQLHLYFQDRSIFAVSSLPSDPFVAEHVAHALEEFCQVADGMDALLQSEFGGRTTFADSTPSSVKH